MPIYAMMVNGKPEYMDEWGRSHDPSEFQKYTPDVPLTEKISGVLSSAAAAVSDTARNIVTNVRNMPENIGGLLAVNSAALTSSYDYWSKTDADKNQELQNAANALNMAPSALYLSDKQTQDETIEASKPKIVFEELAQQSPILANYLADYDNMARSHDDIGVLQSIVNAGQNIADGYSLANATYRLNEIDQQAQSENKAPEELADDLKKERQELYQRVKELEGNIDGSLLGGATNLVTEMGLPLWEGAKQVALGAAVGAAAGAAIAPKQPSLQTVGGIAGGAVGAGSVMSSMTARFAGNAAAKLGVWAWRIGTGIEGYKQGTGSMYRHLLESGYTKESAREGAYYTGAINGLLSVPLSATTSLESIILKDTASSGILKRMGVNAIENSFIGAGMTFGRILGEKVANGTPFDWDGEDLGNMAVGGAQMAAVGVALGVPGYGWMGLRRMGLISDQSLTMQRNPEAAAQLINSVIKNDVSIDAERLYTYLKTLPEEDAKKIMDALKITAEKHAEKLQTGDDLHVTVGDLLKLPESVREELYPDLKVDGKPSARDMQDAWDAERKSETPETAEKAKAEYQKLLDDNPDYRKASESREETAELPDGYRLREAEEMNQMTEDIRRDLDDSPLYKAEDELSSDVRDPKKQADDYQQNKMTPEEELRFEAVAEKNGYTSGDHLAKAIKQSRTKADELQIRLSEAIDATRKANGFDKESIAMKKEVGDGAVKKAAMEKAAIDEEAGIAAPDKESLALLRATDTAVAKLETVVKKTKNDKLKERIKELRAELNHAKKEGKYNVRWAKAEDRLVLDVKLGKLRAEIERLKHAAKEERENLKWTKAEDQLIMDIELGKLEAKLKENREKRLARNSDMTISEIKMKSRERLSNMRVAEAADWKKFQRLAKKAHALSERFYHKGDYAEALNWKNREVLNQQMSMDSLKMFEWLKKRESFFGRIANGSKRIFSSDEEINQLGRLLGRFNVKVRQYMEQPGAETLPDWVARMQGDTGNVRIDDWIVNEYVKKDFYDLKASEIQSLYLAVRNIQTVSRFERKLITDGMRETVAEATVRQIAELRKKPGTHKRQNEKKWKNVFSIAVSDQKKMDTIMSELGGDDSFLWKFWVGTVRRLADQESAAVREMAEKYKSIWNRYSKSEQKALDKKIYIEELGVSLTKKDLIHLAMHTGSEVNRKKLFSTKPVDLSDAIRWDEDTGMTVFQKYLDKKDWETVQQQWDLLDTLWPKIEEHERRLTGFSPEKRQNLAFNITAADGEIIHMKGGYSPLARDVRGDYVADMQAEADAPLYMMNHSAMNATTRHGFTKEVTGAEYSVSIDPQLIERHITDVLHDYYFRDFVSDMNRVMKDRDFQEAIYERSGKAGMDALTKYVNTIAGADYSNTGSNIYRDLLGYFKKASAMSAITMNLRVIAQNLSNIILYPGAVRGFGASDAAIGIVKYGLCDFWPKTFLNWRASKEYVSKMSPFMQDLMERPDYTFREFQKDLFGGRYKNMIAEFSSRLMWYSDAFTSVPMWKRAYEKKMNETGNELLSREYADLLVSRVNGSPRRYDVSPFMREKPDTIMGQMNTFMGFFNTEANRWFMEVGKAKESVRSWPRFLGFVAARVLLFAPLSELIMGNGPDEDRDESTGGWMARTALKYPASLFPGTRDAIPPIIDTKFNQDNYGYRAPMIFSVLSNFYQAGAAIAKAPETDDYAKAFEKTAKLGFMLKGWPQVINNLFWNAYDYDQNNMDEWELMDFLRRRPANERG